MHYKLMYMVLLVLVAIRVYSMPQVFCGDRLTKMMSQYCLSYNTPAHRVKREIVKECCRKPCSLEYMLSYYCASYNRDALKKYTDENKSTENYIKAKNEITGNDNPIGSFHYHTDLLFPQVRQNNASRNSQLIHVHVDHIHHDWELSSEPSPASHNRNRRKIKISRDKSNKDSNGKNTLKEAGFVKNPAREPKLGQIEDSQRPFYVFKRYKR